MFEITATERWRAYVLVVLVMSYGRRLAGVGIHLGVN